MVVTADLDTLLAQCRAVHSFCFAAQDVVCTQTEAHLYHRCPNFRSHDHVRVKSFGIVLKTRPVRYVGDVSRCAGCDDIYVYSIG